MVAIIVVVTALGACVSLSTSPVQAQVAHTTPSDAVWVSSPGDHWTSGGAQGPAVLTYGHQGCGAIDAADMCTRGTWTVIPGAPWIWKSRLSDSAPLDAVLDRSIEVAEPMTCVVTYAADASVEIRNGNTVVAAPVPGSWSTPRASSIRLHEGTNELTFAVSDTDTSTNDPRTNPTGLAWRIDQCEPTRLSVAHHLPGGRFGVPYVGQLTATGCAHPESCIWINGTSDSVTIDDRTGLPPGWTIDQSAGVINGRWTGRDDYPIVARVTLIDVATVPETIVPIDLVLTTQDPAAYTPYSGTDRLVLPIFLSRDADFDEDGLPDVWEIEGADTNGNGIADLDIRMLGALPGKPDLFLEIDWMANCARCEPSRASLALLVEAFEHPVDSPKGPIRLHIDAGRHSPDHDISAAYRRGGHDIPAAATFLTCQPDSQGQADCCPADDQGVQQCDGGLLKFDQLFERPGLHWPTSVFRQVAVVRETACRCVYGQADNTYPSGSGKYGPGVVLTPPSEDVRRLTYAFAGVLMHELGHTLGLSHGAHESDDSHNPQHLSVMSYCYIQFGVPEAPASFWVDLAHPTSTGSCEGLVPNEDDDGWVGFAGGALTYHRDPAAGVTVDSPYDTYNAWNELKLENRTSIGNPAWAPPGSPPPTVLVRRWSDRAGSSRVGRTATLTATRAGPEASVRYSWYIGNKLVGGARSLTIRPGWRGHTLTARVDVSRDGTFSRVRQLVYPVVRR